MAGEVYIKSSLLLRSEESSCPTRRNRSNHQSNPIFIVTTVTMHILTPLLSLATLVSALDIRLHSTSNCGGWSTDCPNINPSVRNPTSSPPIPFLKPSLLLIPILPIPPTHTFSIHRSN